VAASGDDGYVYGATTQSIDTTGGSLSVGKGTYVNHSWCKFNGIAAAHEGELHRGHHPVPLRCGLVRDDLQSDHSDGHRRPGRRPRLPRELG